MEQYPQMVEKVSRIPSVGGGSRIQSCLPRPTSCANEHHIWKGWIGKQVAISGVKLGTLLFYGKTQFAEGFFCGVALDEPEGKHDGSVNGVRYFTCEPNHGVFAPITKVQRIEISATENLLFNGTKAVVPSSLPSPVSAAKAIGNLTFTRIFQGLGSSGSSGKVHSPVDYGAPLNVSFIVGQPKETRKTVLNRTFEKEDHNATFLFSEDAQQSQQLASANSTFNIDTCSATSPQQNETFCLDNKEQQILYDITEDDMDESSLGILTASQMFDMSNDNLNLCCDIPKTQSCDDINELPEDEVVENITVEYLGSKDHKGNFTFDLSSDDTIISSPNTSRLMNDDTVHTSTPVQSDNEPQSCLKSIDDFQMIKKAINVAKETLNETFPVTFPLDEDVSLLESQELSCSFQDVTIHTRGTLIDEKLPKDANIEMSSSSILSKTIVNTCNDPSLVSSFSETIKPNIAEELDLLNETLKYRLASGEITDHDRFGRVSIETVMEVIQRQEMYKNRPASTYTVGSTDTGYQGDGECDCHSETAGSPCEEVKPLSLCSQEETDNTDKMMKSGHMSDSDFFTDQGASSEMELDGEMKQSVSSLLSDGRAADISTILPEEMQVLSVADEEKNNSSSAEGDQTVIEEAKKSSRESRANETVVLHKEDKMDCSEAVDLPESTSLGKESASTVTKASKSMKLQKDVSRTKPEIKPEPKKSTRTAKTLVPPEPVKKIVRSPRKASKWDAVTSKIAAGLAEEKTKERRTVKSRVNTNLSGARQVNTSSRKSQCGDSIAEAPSRTDSTPQGDCLKGTNQGQLDSPVEARIRVAKTPQSRPISPAVASEISSTTCSSTPSSYAPKARIQSKIALPKRNLSDRCRPAKPTEASSTESKRSRPAQTSAAQQSTQHPQQPQQKESSQLKTTKTAIVNRTPTLSSRAAHAKIEDLTAEVQRLGALCEQRTKELNVVKMQLKHTYCGFDAFAIMVNYLVGELDAFSHPKLLADMRKTREQLASSQILLGQYENDLEHLKKQHSEEVCELAKELDRTRCHVASLSSQLEETQSLCRIELEEVQVSCTTQLAEADERYQKKVEDIEAQHDKQIQELQLKQTQVQEETKRIHEVEVAELLVQLEELKEKSQSLELQSKQFEEALQRDTDSKIQWMYAKNAKLVAEVDSLKSVMEMKQAEIHSLRKENMQLGKELEELPLAQKQIENLRARNEDLQAVVREKSLSERKLCRESMQIKDICERVHKDNRRVSMENEELQWKLQQMLDGSWSGYVSEQDNSTRENNTLPSPGLSPWQEADEDRPLSTSPINFYALGASPHSPQSSASSPGKSPNRLFAVGVRQRHRSLGPHKGDPPLCPRPTTIDRSQSLRESELYLKARLEFDSDQQEADGHENGAHSDVGSLSSSTTGSSISSCDPEDTVTHHQQAVDPGYEEENIKVSEMCSPRNLAGEAISVMISGNESPFDRSHRTSRTPEHHQMASSCMISDPDDSCDSE